MANRKRDGINCQGTPNRLETNDINVPADWSSATPENCRNKFLGCGRIVSRLARGQPAEVESVAAGNKQQQELRLLTAQTSSSTRTGDLALRQPVQGVCVLGRPKPAAHAALAPPPYDYFTECFGRVGDPHRVWLRLPRRVFGAGGQQVCLLQGRAVGAKACLFWPNILDDPELLETSTGTFSQVQQNQLARRDYLNSGTRVDVQASPST